MPPLARAGPIAHVWLGTPASFGQRELRRTKPHWCRVRLLPALVMQRDPVNSARDILDILRGHLRIEGQRDDTLRYPICLRKTRRRISERLVIRLQVQRNEMDAGSDVL